MTDPKRALCLLVSTLAFTAGAAADEVRLTDGRTIYGAVHNRGGVLVIDTKEGTVSVAASDVLRVRSEADLRTELAGLASRCEPMSAFCCLHLAHVARVHVAVATEQLLHVVRGRETARRIALARRRARDEAEEHDGREARAVQISASVPPPGLDDSETAASPVSP